MEGACTSWKQVMQVMHHVVWNEPKISPAWQYGSRMRNTALSLLRHVPNLLLLLSMLLMLMSVLLSWLELLLLQACFWPAILC